MDDSLILKSRCPVDFIVWIHNSKRPVKGEYYNNHQGDINFVKCGSETHIIIKKTTEKKPRRTIQLLFR